LEDTYYCCTTRDVRDDVNDETTSGREHQAALTLTDTKIANKIHPEVVRMILPEFTTAISSTS
jgi:thymidylate synthase ThyX